MDTAGIRKSYLSISSPGVYLAAPAPGGGDETAAKAASLCRRINQYGANIKKQHPSRFGYFASLPLPDVERALAEIDYCISELSVDGFVVLSNAFGMYLGDGRMEPVYEKLNARPTVLFVHPTAPCTAQNAFSSSGSSPLSAQVPSPVKPPAYLAANVPLIDCYASPMLEFLFDSTRTVTDVLLTGTATRYPNIRWIIPHCGATLPSILDRVIRFSQNLPTKVGTKRTTAPLSESNVRQLLTTQFYFDLAGLPMNSQIHHILRWSDHTRLLFGSDVPFAPWSLGQTLADETREELVNLFGIETGAHEILRICYGNAEDLFPAT